MLRMRSSGADVPSAIPSKQALAEEYVACPNAPKIAATDEKSARKSPPLTAMRRFTAPKVFAPKATSRCLRATLFIIASKTFTTQESNQTEPIPTLSLIHSEPQPHSFRASA